MLAYLSALGKPHILKETDNPITVLYINVSEEEFRSKHSEQDISDATV